MFYPDVLVLNTKLSHLCCHLNAHVHHFQCSLLLLPEAEAMLESTTLLLRTMMA